MVRYVSPAENSQGKWNEIIDSDNSKDWKLEKKYLRYSSKRFYGNHTRNNQHVTYP
jgi:hypothetical protein